MHADRRSTYLIIPELSNFLVLHGRVVPDEVGGFIFVPGLNEVHFIDGYANWGLEWVSYLISYATNLNNFHDIMTHIGKISPLQISDLVPFCRAANDIASLWKYLIVCNALPNHRKHNIHYAASTIQSHVLNKLGFNYLQSSSNVGKWHLCM